MDGFRKLTLAVVASSLVTLAGCGGSSGGSSGGGSSSGSGGTPPPGSAAQTGVFLDSPVANIGYRTATHEGVTNASGQYQYAPGETVTFFIGDLEFPPVPAAGVVTPLDIAGTTDTSNPVVINIARLLQTLDVDGDPSNGITISELAKNNATQVDFSATVTDFANSTAVTTLIQNGGQDSPVTTLISEADARSHLEGTLENESVAFTNETSITGGWLLDTGDGPFIFLAFDASTGTYVQVEEKEYEFETEEGLEFGKFSLDEDNILTATANFYDENGDIGLHPGSDGEIVKLIMDGDGDATMNILEDDELEELSVTRIRSDGIVGTWINVDTNPAEGEILLLAFLDNGTYVHAEVFNDSGDENKGAEIGPYSLNSQTGVLSIGDLILDTNDDAGLSDFVGRADLLVNVSGNTLILTVTENGETEDVVFKRL